MSWFHWLPTLWRRNTPIAECEANMRRMTIKSYDNPMTINELMNYMFNIEPNIVANVLNVSHDRHQRTLLLKFNSRYVDKFKLMLADYHKMNGKYCINATMKQNTNDRNYVHYNVRITARC